MALRKYQVQKYHNWNSKVQKKLEIFEDMIKIVILVTGLVTGYSTLSDIRYTKCQADVIEKRFNYRIPEQSIEYRMENSLDYQNFEN